MPGSELFGRTDVDDQRATPIGHDTPVPPNPQ
jgi:hypothetical protein